MTELVRYNAALLAIAEAKAVDELLTIRDSADALRAAARVANNKQAEVDMAEIRFRAERRVGEMMAEQRRSEGLSEGGRPTKTGFQKNPVSSKATLAEAGIDKNLADRARKLAAIPQQEFNSIVGDWRGRVEAEGERVTVNLLKAGEKRLSRDEKEAALAQRIRVGVDALNQGQFGVILADPPWRFEPYSRDTGMDRAADNHYPTMDAGAIAELEVPAADDCVLFLWATAPMLPVALHVMAVWGFEYKSQIIWVKDRIGTGYWARNKHELLLIGTRGEIPAPAPGTQPDSAIVAPVSAHSAKPEIFHEIIERLFPNLPKIEMFSRRARSGWHGWGAETDKFDPETGEIIEPVSTLDRKIGEAVQGASDLSDIHSTNTPGESGTAREASGGPAPGDGIAGLSQADDDHSSAGVASSADPTPEQHGAQPAPHTNSDVPTHGASPAPGGASDTGSSSAGNPGEAAAHTNSASHAADQAGSGSDALPADTGSHGAHVTVGVRPTSPAGVEGDADRQPIAWQPKPYAGPHDSQGLPRPVGCQHLDRCGSKTWRQRCWTCEKTFAVTAGGTPIEHMGGVA